MPPEVEVTERSAPDGRRLIFLLRASAEPKAVPLGRPMRDVWVGETVSGEVTLPPFGVRVLCPEGDAGH